MVPVELPLYPNSRETIVDSDDEDLDGLREDPLAGGDEGPWGGVEVGRC